ncbi:hypothetical protein COCON_G00007740 [Conger conger]|uniref:Uncharacterized protein n=1 Tax=Conger conger TaxID=82655 RepID=A0A9Q1E1Y0_CONCO|nr:hypothetical protein COCON_G00007740 [Conger conger]
MRRHVNAERRDGTQAGVGRGVSGGFAKMSAATPPVSVTAGEKAFLICLAPTCTSMI